MNNDLNKQLCELCGIKPRYGIYVDYGDLDHNYKLETNERKYRLIADYRWYYSVDDEDLRDLKPEFYPDFTKPENFVRLFNLRTKRQKSYTVAELITLECMAIIDTKNFLENLIYIIKSDMDVADIKQSIREAEWVYE